jgi:glutathione S-transferase
MTLKVYGPLQSRTYRVLWMVTELGIPFEHIPTSIATDAKTDSYKKLNPNGRVPTIDDDGLVVWESMAINLYLAKKYGRDLAPQTVAEEAHATQWSFWVMTEVEKPLLQALFSTLGMLGMPKDPEKVRASYEELKPPFGVLNQHLAGSKFLIADRFTVADVNVAAVMSGVQAARLDLSPWPNIKRWLDGCLAREAASKARGK